MESQFLCLNVLKTEIHQITEYTLGLYSTITTDWMLVLDLSHGRQNLMHLLFRNDRVRKIHFERSTL